MGSVFGMQVELLHQEEFKRRWECWNKRYIKAALALFAMQLYRTIRRILFQQLALVVPFQASA
jgi:hypothetical protein